MPYKVAAPAFVKRLPEEQQTRWLAAWNAEFEESGSETIAFKAANGALNLSSWAEMRNASDFQLVTCFVSDVFADWKPDGVYEVQYCRTGLWKDHPQYGDIFITKEDLLDAVRNFRNASRKPFLDYNHGITDGDPEDVQAQKAAGWMADLWIESVSGERLEPKAAAESRAKVLVLKARYEVNPPANEALKNKEYALFSPTFYPYYRNKETGEAQGMTAIGGAMTNIPYFDGMSGFVAVAASDRMSGIVRQLATMWQDRGQRRAGGSEDRTVAGGGGKEGATTTAEETMSRSAEERVRLAGVLKLSEKATDAEIDEKLSSLVAMAEKAPKPGEVTITAEELVALKKGSETALKLAAEHHVRERERCIGEAIRTFRIKEANKEKWVARYDADPKGAAEILAELEPMESSEEIGHGGSQPVPGQRKGESRAMAEINRLTDEAIKAGGTDKDGKPRLTRAAARRQVFDQREDLYNAYRGENTRNVASRGGDR